jgi:hypothetical protein
MLENCNEWKMMHMRHTKQLLRYLHDANVTFSTSALTKEASSSFESASLLQKRVGIG